MRDIAGELFDEDLLRVPLTPSTSLPAPEDRERLYRELWPAVRGMLRRRYTGVADHEELYQEAWTELLEYEADGHVVRDTRALLTTIAERRAQDRIRAYRPAIVDPDSPTFTRTVDVSALPEEQVQVRLDAARIRQVVEALDEREATALKLRFDLLLDAREISTRLGITPKRLEKVMTSAYRQIAEALAVGADGQSAWSRRQRSLLLACETGVATTRQRRRAAEMLANDPHCRATLAELRVALRDVAAALPLPVAVEEERTRRVLESMVDYVDRVLPGSRGAGRQLAETVAPSGAAEPITFSVAAIGAGGAAKVALACLAAGGTAAACLTIGTPGRSEPPRATKPAVRAEPSRPAVREPRSASLIEPRVVVTTSAETTKAKTPTRTRRPRLQPETPVSSPQSQPAVSPAPAGSTEFGPGALGSAQAPTTPAVAPSNGGGEFTP